MANPFLARRIRAFLDGAADWNEDKDKGAAAAAAEWAALRPLLAQYWRRLPEKVLPCHAPGRLKRWLNLLRQRFPEAGALYRDVRALPDGASVAAALARHGIRVDGE